MTDFFYTQTAAQLQANHDKVSATSAPLKDESNTQVENRFKGNQNWNVEGRTGNPLPDSTPRLYSVGSEIVSGVEVITTSAGQITYTAGVLNSGNNTGIIRRKYAKDPGGLITKSTQYGGIKLPDGTQLQALVDDISTNGVRITEVGQYVAVDVDLSKITTGFRFFGLSDEKGVWKNTNTSESKSNMGKIIDYSLSSTSWYVLWENGYIEQGGQRTVSSAGTITNFPLAVRTFLGGNAIHYGGDNTINCSIFEPSGTSMKIAGGSGANVLTFWEMRGLI